MLTATDNGEVWWICGGVEACDIGGMPVRVVRGSADDELFRRTTLYPTGFPIFDGGAANNEREHSEVWYQAPATLADADRLAKAVEKKLGAISPRPWEWGGHYPMVLVIGKKKIEASAGSEPTMTAPTPAE